jgi:hypothetical protein
MFSYYTMCLNEIKEGQESLIAPTDSRLRSDVRALEMADLGNIK